MNGFRDMVGFIWSVADLLRGDYKQSEYGKVMLPLTVLRPLDCALEPEEWIRELLRECRQALVAAVTGNLGITRAHGGAA